MADALGVLNILMNLQDDFREGQLNMGKSWTLLQRLGMAAIKPYEAIVVAMKLASMGKEKNPIHSGKFSQGYTLAAFSQDFKIDQFEQIAFKYNISFNQLMSNVLGQALKLYILSKDNKNTK
jgi:hypothetical protein